MKVVALVHYAVPYRMAGSETMVHAMMEQLVRAGHDVVVVVNEMKEFQNKDYKHGNVQYKARRGLAASRLVLDEKPDLIITHHQNTMVAHKLAKQARAKSCLIVHNDLGAGIDFARQDWDFLVFNTEWLREVYREHDVDGIVVHPPVYPEDHATTPGGHITLVNLNEDKGSLIFYRLAEDFPNLKFLGVTGAHGKQLIRYDLPNVEIIPNTPTMKEDVWSRTGILLMPSIYESYGMAGVEALASGIPVIANPTPGLVESLGDAGVFVPRDNYDAWKTQLRNLTSKSGWRYWSGFAKERSMELFTQTRNDLDTWADAVAALEKPSFPNGQTRVRRARKVLIPTTTYKPQASIIVPWRETPDRAENWAWLRTWYNHYHPEWELIEADVPGEWNKSLAVNEGARLANTGTLLVMDADVLINPGSLRAAVREAERAPWVVPHGKVHRLRPEPTQRLLGSYPAEVVAVPHTPVIRTPYVGVAGGGAFAMTKEKFLAMGGFDPVFTGWGGEDTSFGIAADTFYGPAVRYHHVPLVHLFHDPGLRTVHPKYGENHGRQMQYEKRAHNPGAMAEFLGIEVPRIGTGAVVRPERHDPVERWLTYLAQLGVPVPRTITHQVTALIALAVQEETRRGL